MSSSIATDPDYLSDASPLAEPADVRAEIGTELGDDEIEGRLDSALQEIAIANDIEVMADPLRRQLERYYVSYKIRAWADRGLSSGDRETVSISFDGSPLEELERRVQALDPSGQLLPGEGDDPAAGGASSRRTASYGSGRPHSADGTGSPYR